MKCPHCKKEIENKDIIKEAMSQLGKKTSEKKKKAVRENGKKPKTRRGGKP